MYENDGTSFATAAGAVDLVVNEWSSSGIAGLGTTTWLLYPNLCP